MGLCNSVLKGDSYLPTPQDVVDFTCGSSKHLASVSCTSGCNGTLIQTMSNILMLACTVAIGLTPGSTTTPPVVNGCAPVMSYSMSSQEAIAAAIREADKALTIPGYRISFTSAQPCQADVAFMMVMVAVLASRREFPSVGRALAFTCLPELFYASTPSTDGSVSSQALQIIGLLDNIKYPTTGKTLLPGQLLLAITPFFLVCGNLNRCFSTSYAKSGKVAARGPNIPVSPGIYRLGSTCKPVLYFSESSPTSMIVSLRSSLDSTCPKAITSSKLSSLPKNVRKEVHGILKAQAAASGQYTGSYGCELGSSYTDSTEDSSSDSSSDTDSSSDSSSETLSDTDCS